MIGGTGTVGLRILFVTPPLDVGTLLDWEAKLTQLGD